MTVPFNVADSGTANGTVQVNYISTATPEPTAASIFVLGGLLTSGALLIRRRRSKLNSNLS